MGRGRSITRSLGLDIGDRRIGVALSDPGRVLASPLTVIEREGSELDVESIVDIVRRHEVQDIVVGLPRSMDGSLGQQAEKVRVFTRQLRSRIGIPVVFRDERLTTVSARRLLRTAGVKKGKGKVSDDAIAAALILQSYLDEEPSPKP